MTDRILPTQERLKQIIDYDPETGIFTWKFRTDVSGGWNANFAGKPAGTRLETSIVIFIDSEPYGAHRLAWVYVNGGSLERTTYVDHINCDCYDNRIANLRLATHGQNCTNSRLRRGKGLPKGVSFQRNGKYRARIGVDKSVVYLGTYSTAEDAHSAYVAAAQATKGAFARAE